jgi:hypothetical protein
LISSLDTPPIDAGNAGVIFQDELPPALVAVLPERKIPAGETTIASSPIISDLHIQQAHIFAAAASNLASLLGEKPPGYVLAAPYLSELIWSGNLLLIPDGSGLYLSQPVNWLYQRDPSGADQPLIDRAAVYNLLRTWLHSQFADPRLEYQPLLTPPGKKTRQAGFFELTETLWEQEQGHWLQLASNPDVDVTWNPRWQGALSPEGEWSALAFWLAMELADPQTRQGDLDLMTYFQGEGREIKSYSRRYALMHERLWPDIMEVEAARQLILALHQWVIAGEDQDEAEAGNARGDPRTGNNRLDLIFSALRHAQAEAGATLSLEDFLSEAGVNLADTEW